MDTCERKHKQPVEAVSVIPFPATIQGVPNGIKICVDHAREAREKGFYVEPIDRPDDPKAKADFERVILHKHIKLRGSREYKYFPGPEPDAQFTVTTQLSDEEVENWVSALKRDLAEKEMK